MRFLLDANLFPKTAEYLRRSFSFNVSSLIELGTPGLSDSEVVEMAVLEKRIIITFDLDFGKLYHESADKSGFAVIIIRSNDQRRKHVEELLNKFFTKLKTKNAFTFENYPLVVIEDTAIRTIVL